MDVPRRLSESGELIAIMADSPAGCQSLRDIEEARRAIARKSGFDTPPPKGATGVHPLGLGEGRLVTRPFPTNS